MKLLLNESAIKNIVKSLAERINEDYKNECPVIIGVLNGSFIFLADLVRELMIDCEIDFMTTQSYINNQRTSVYINKENSIAITNRNVILVEDIIDSGETIVKLSSFIYSQNPKSFSICALLNKNTYSGGIEIDYEGQIIPNEFVFGYGMDNNGKQRGLKDIYYIEK